MTERQRQRGSCMKKGGKEGAMVVESAVGKVGAKRR